MNHISLKCGESYVKGRSYVEGRHISLKVGTYGPGGRAVHTKHNAQMFPLLAAVGTLASI